MALWSEGRQCMSSILLNVLHCFHGPECVCLDEWSVGAWDKLCVLLSLDEAASRCPLYPADWVLMRSSLPLVTPACWICPFLREEHSGLQLWWWIHLLFLALLSVFASHSLTHCCLALRTVLSSWRINPFIVTSCPSLALIAFPTLTSSPSDINMPISFLFWRVLARCVFLHLLPFHLCVCVSFI